MRPSNFLRACLVRSPGSWGSDIISLTLDWEDTFILEAEGSALTARVRENFRGYKLIPTKEKYFLAPREPSARDCVLLKNNGFKALVLRGEVDKCWDPLSNKLAHYIDRQLARVGRSRRA
jgi:hypothetical protein